MNDSIDALRYALRMNNEVDRLLYLLAKFNIKAAQNKYRTLGKGAPLNIEPLNVVFKSVSFDMGNIRLWSTKRKYGTMLYHVPAVHKLCMLLHKFGVRDAKNYLPVGINPDMFIDDIT